MKKRTKLVVYLLVMCLMVSLIPNNAAAAKRIKLSSKSITLYIGQTRTIKLKGTTKKPKWSSSSKSVATVSKKGKIKAKKQGSAVITAKLGKKKYKCKVRVKTKVRPNPSGLPNEDVPQNDNTMVAPTSAPTSNSAVVPTSNPTVVPTSVPTIVPTSNPTAVPTIAPTSNPTAVPTTIPTAVPTVADNYQKLAEYIVENGTYSENGEYYYISGPSDEEIYTSCDYNLDGSYTFSIMYTYSGADDLVTVTITPPDYAKGAVANIFVQSSDSSSLLYANGEVVLSTLTKTNHSITYTETNASTKDLRDNLYQLGESVFGVGLQCWNEMIVNTGLGLSLKDFGFTSYEEDVVTTPTVADNYQKLAEYLVANGEYDAEHEYYYINDLTDDCYTICRYNLDGSYVFSEMFMSSTNNADDLVSITITPPEYTKGSVVNVFVQSKDTSNALYAEGEVVLSSLTETNHNITYTSTNAPTQDVRDSLYKLGNSVLGLGLKNWNEMIVNTGLGIGLKDLGFTSY